MTHSHSLSTGRSSYIPPSCMIQEVTPSAISNPFHLLCGPNYRITGLGEMLSHWAMTFQFCSYPDICLVQNHTHLVNTQFMDTDGCVCVYPLFPIIGGRVNWHWWIYGRVSPLYIYIYKSQTFLMSTYCLDQKREDKRSTWKDVL